MKDALKLWLSQYPGSYHPQDNKRFIQFVIASHKERLLLEDEFYDLLRATYKELSEERGEAFLKTINLEEDEWASFYHKYDSYSSFLTTCLQHQELQRELSLYLNS